MKRDGASLCRTLELLDLLAATYRVRHRYFGNTVQLYFLMNAKSGLCPEDCRYCSQSKVSEAEIPRYNLLNREKLLDGARVAARARLEDVLHRDLRPRPRTSARSPPSPRSCREIKQQYGLNVCACLGLLTPDQAQRLKACGVDKVNHNLNTSERFYPEICTTHTYADRVDTLQAVRDAGMAALLRRHHRHGRERRDVVEMAFALRDLGVESIPVNFLNPIDGTPLARTHRLNPRYCLKALCMFRFVNPASELRIAGGREMHLGSLQADGPVRRQLDLCGRLPHDQRPVARSRLPDDRGDGICRNAGRWRAMGRQTRRGDCGWIKTGRSTRQPLWLTLLPAHENSA